MTSFKVFLHEDKDEHFKIALKAFDKDSSATYDDKEKFYIVKSITLSKEDLLSFTSVSKVEYLFELGSNTISGSWAKAHGYGNGGGRATDSGVSGLSFSGTRDEIEFLERYT